MFHHVVLFTWNDSVPDGHPEAARAELTAYSATLEGLVSYRCGANLGLSQNAADFGIVAVFENEAAWHAYDTADEHNRIRREVFAPYVATRSVIQFEA